MSRKHSKRNLTIAALAVLCVAVFTAAFAGNAVNSAVSRVFNSVGNTAADGFDTSKDFVKIMDVGQGDGILIYSNGCSAVIDAGLASKANDICLDLDGVGIKDIDAFIITHLHADHAAGLPRIAERYKINNLILPETEENAEAAEAVNTAKQLVASQKGNVYTAVQGMNFEIGEFEITILAYYDEMSGENNKSIITMAEIGGLKFLFTGDAESEAERALLDEGLNVDCDVLKVGHHGSNSSSVKAFLKAASPEFAAISVGKDNMYSHPSKKVTDALNSCGAEIFRTDLDGDIVFYVENGKIKPETER